MRRNIFTATLAVLISLAIQPLRAEDLSRWIWVAQAPEPASSIEVIPKPPEPVLDCPSLEQLGYRTKALAELSLDIALHDTQLPADCSHNVFQSLASGDNGRGWCDAEFNWAATDLFAQPAYFDDPLLERYGQTRRPLIQPWLSGVLFFSQFPLMPYKIAVDRPFDKIYTLGYYRPGSPTPCLSRRLPRP